MAHFSATRWTLVAQARGNDTAAKTALSQLCEAYYAPVVTFLTCEGRSADVARELAHDFFAAVLAGRPLATADPARGRFRSYLLGAVKHFAADRRERARAARRGGGVSHDELDPEIPGADPPADHERAFDRQWALTVIARALETTRQELEEAGKARQFHILKPTIAGGNFAPADAAQQLGLSDGALKVAVHRLRQRFREAVKDEIAHTVPAESEIDDELRHLLAVLTG
jgi:DNA-directed RNA polymerase specialized sigma24 family protein